MENNIKKVFLVGNENCEQSYFFAPSIGRKKNIGGKIYYVRRYFNGDRDFESSMKKFATNNYYKNER